MRENKRVIHVIGLNSFKFKDLSLEIQELFFTIQNIAAPESFYIEIKN